MKNPIESPQNAALNRRDFLRLSAAGVAAVGAGIAFAEPASAAPLQTVPSLAGQQPARIYSDLLKTWCDGLLEHQVTGMGTPALTGGFLCPSCVLIHGRCADAVYPLLHMAHRTGDERYLKAALDVYDWSEAQVSRPDGSWINDVVLSSWQGITVFRAISLGEALHHHGSVLDAATRQRWADRLAKAAKFLDGFITIQTGNINYPVTSSYAFALCGEVLGDDRYMQRGRAMAQTAMEYFTPNHLLFGEGHPQASISRKGCRAVDLGYNIEESLPALALYSLLADDQPVREKVVESLRAHLEFMLPDGAWDNSWGTRNFKWTWWGSRTSDGCHPAFTALAKYDPRFAEAARRNVELMAACTKGNLLYGGPDYGTHGDFPCIHHTFTHAKALATVLDRGVEEPAAASTPQLPRDMPYGLRTFPEVGTYLAAIGDWRGTVTEYDFEYVETVQTTGGTGGGGGGHATGGALSLLYHQTLGPVCVASTTKYQVLELANQQPVRGPGQMTLTPRIECAGTPVFTSLNDLEAQVTTEHTPERVSITATGRLQTTAHDAPSTGDVRYRLEYIFEKSGMEIHAEVTAETVPNGPMRFVLPVVSRPDEPVDSSSQGTIQISKPKGRLTVTTSADGGFEPLPQERAFNLIPGFQCLPLTVAVRPGGRINIRLEAEARQES
jgi:Ubiquitinol-cytochrome C reductase Fe-S subunit TAT signal